MAVAAVPEPAPHPSPAADPTASRAASTPARENQKGPPMRLHPLHEVYLGIRADGAPARSVGDLHPLHQVYLGAAPAAVTPAEIGGEDTPAGLAVADPDAASRSAVALPAATVAERASA